MLLAFVLLMEEGGGVRERDAKKEPKAKQCSARPTEVVGGANILGALRVLKVGPTSV